MKKTLQDLKRRTAGSSLKDEVLISMALEGRELAFTLLVQRYQALVRSIVSRYLRQEQEIEEATQDTFLRAFRSLHGFRGDCKFSTWLTRVAISTSLNALRRQKHVPTESIEILMIADIPAPISIEQQETGHFLRLAMEQLTAKDRLIVELFYFGECSILEIQQQTGWGASDIKSRLCRARQRLRAVIEEHFEAVLAQRA